MSFLGENMKKGKRKSGKFRKKKKIRTQIARV
jgi:hypothetical protein